MSVEQNALKWIHQGKANGRRYFTIILAMDSDREDYQYAVNIVNHDNIQESVKPWGKTAAVYRQQYGRPPKVVMCLTMKSTDKPTDCELLVAQSLRRALLHCVGFLQTDWLRPAGDGMSLGLAFTHTLNAKEKAKVKTMGRMKEATTELNPQEWKDIQNRRTSK